jgi:hypothetical protein
MDARSARVEIQGGQVMEEMEDHTAYLEGLGIMKAFDPMTLVGVSPDSRHRGDREQGAHDIPGSDISRVDNEVGAAEFFKRTGAGKPVCVGDYADNARRHACENIF